MTHAVCPECHLPAEVTAHSGFGSTEGPLEHLNVCAAGGHWFTPCADEVVALPEAEAA